MPHGLDQTIIMADGVASAPGSEPAPARLNVPKVLLDFLNTVDGDKSRDYLKRTAAVFVQAEVQKCI